MLALFSRMIWRGEQKAVGRINDGPETVPVVPVVPVARFHVPVPSKPISAQFIVDEVHYVATGHAQPYMLKQQYPTSLATVIRLDGDQLVSANFLNKLILELDSVDDVFKPKFLQGAVFVTDATKSHDDLLCPEAREYLVKQGNEWIEVICTADEKAAIPAAGVYIAHEKSLYEVYRVYNDVQSVFMTTTIPGPERWHIPLTTAAKMPAVGQVAVPTRMGTRESDVLRGLRVAVKDNFRLKGIRASLCNRAFYNTYPEQTQTAACISKLEDAGAHILGTTKLAAFAATEEPSECLDYQAPWNPRADGYQSPAGSSSGSGAAAASYDWLDVTIGSDTSGSGRRPAHWNGCFALRPTHGAVDIRGFIPSFPQFDTPTLFTRDMAMCRKFAAAWYGDSLNPGKADRPVKLLVPTDYLPLITNPEQRRHIDSFISDLETSLNVTREDISLEGTWNASPPRQANGQCFSTYMDKVARNSFFYDDYHNLQQFRDDHQKQFSSYPPISKPVRWQWTLSATITRAERDDAIERLVVYKKWLADVIMEVSRKRAVMVIPIENISPRYRDDAETSFDPVGVPMLFLSPILGGPECTIPIGHVPYQSKMSGREEHLPVAISLLSAPGTDLSLLDLAAKCLWQSGRPTSVDTGCSRMWAFDRGG